MWVLRNLEILGAVSETFRVFGLFPKHPCCARLQWSQQHQPRASSSRTNLFLSLFWAWTVRPTRFRIHNRNGPICTPFHPHRACSDPVQVPALVRLSVRRYRPENMAPERRSERAGPRRRSKIPLACEPCRERKSRCDGAKPICSTCQRRSLPLHHCIYTLENARTASNEA